MQEAWLCDRDLGLRGRRLRALLWGTQSLMRIFSQFTLAPFK